MSKPELHPLHEIPANDRWWELPPAVTEVPDQTLDNWWVYPGKNEASLERASQLVGELDLSGYAEIPTFEWVRWRSPQSFRRPMEGPEPEQFRRLTYEEIAAKGKGWKFHLNFDAENPVKVESIQKVLTTLKGHELITAFKIGKGGGKADGQPGKEATVYVGHRDKAEAVAPFIDEILAGFLDMPEGDALQDDIPFSERVMGRFEVTDLDPDFHQYGAKGHAVLDQDVSDFIFKYMANKAVSETEKTKVWSDMAVKADEALQARYGVFYTGSK